MREKITIKKRDTTYIKGFPKENWNPYYSCRAELLDLYGAEKYSAYQSSLENSIKFKCRMCKKLKDLIGEKLTGYKLVWNDKEYDIIFVDSLNGSRTEIILQVKKVI